MSEYLVASMHAVFLAIGLIMPLGVQNIFVFNQGASHKNYSGALPTIITASLCDALLISLAVVGVSALVLEHVWLKITIFAIGFCFLCYMGCVTWKAAGASSSRKSKALPAKKQILIAASASLLNPHAIIDSVVVIGTNATAYRGEVKWVYAITYIIVSWIWFAALAFAGYRLHKLDSGDFWVKNINKLSAFIIWFIAGYIGLKIFECFGAL